MKRLLSILLLCLFVAAPVYGQIGIHLQNTTISGITSDGTLIYITLPMGMRDGEEFRFYDVGNSNYVGFKAPALTASKIWVLPTADGSADFLLGTNGSGVLSWHNPATIGVASCDLISSSPINVMYAGVVPRVLNATAASITVDRALADGSTLGVASFAAADFSASTGNITLDKAVDLVTTAPITGGTDNVLPGADADITLGIDVLKDLVTTAPLTGGTDDVLPGADSDITIAMPVATTSADGYLSQTDWDTFNGKSGFDPAKTVTVGASGCDYTTVQAAISYAATQSPTATNKWTVLVFPGVYDEVITMSSHVNLVGIGSKNSVVLYRNNASVVTLADAVEVQNLTVRTGATGDIYCFQDNGVACTAKVMDVHFESTYTGGGGWYGFMATGAGDYTFERCSYHITAAAGGTGDDAGFLVNVVAATVRVIDGDYYLAGGDPPTSSKSHLGCVATSNCTFITEGNRFDGDAAANVFYAEDGTFISSNDVMLTSYDDQVAAGATVYIKNGRREYTVDDDDIINFANVKGSKTKETFGWDEGDSRFEASDDVDVDGTLSGTNYASDGSVSDAEFKYVNTLSSNAQDQIDAKLPIQLNAGLTVNETYSGQTASITVGETVVFGQMLVKKADGEYYKTDADAVTTMPAMAVALEGKDNGQACLVLIQGWVCDTDWNWTVGDGATNLLYADDGTAGAMDQTAPTDVGDQVQVVGHVESADCIYFNPSYVLVEIE